MINCISNISNKFQLNLKNDIKNSVNFNQQSDIYVKSARKPLSNIELLKILQSDCNGINISKKFFDSLSEKEYDFCLNFANRDEKIFSGMVLYRAKSVLPEDVEDVVKYSKVFYKGLENIAKKNNKTIDDIILVSIGQSPSVVTKTMEYKGINTAYCPISGLSNLEKPYSQYFKKKDLDIYFNYCKKFNFDIDKISKEKLVIFTDYAISGKSIDVFKDIILKYKKTDFDKKFLSMKYIFNQSNPNGKEKAFGNYYENNLMYNSYLKTLYSPYFKVKYSNIAKISDYHRDEICSESDLRYIKLFILIHDMLKYPDKYPCKKRDNNALSYERDFRLGFYTPD